MLSGPFLSFPGPFCYFPLLYLFLLLSLLLVSLCTLPFLTLFLQLFLHQYGRTWECCCSARLLTGLEGVGVGGKIFITTLDTTSRGCLYGINLSASISSLLSSFRWEMLNNWTRARSLKGSACSRSRVYLSVGMASEWQVSNQHKYSGSIRSYPLHTFVCNSPPALLKKWVTSRGRDCEWQPFWGE